MAEVNLFEVEVEGPDRRDPPGFRARYRRLRPLLRSKKIGGTVYELPPGEAICPYHYEYGNEEWLIVLSGRPTLRTPDGERTLGPGDTVCFNEGPQGAHQVRAGKQRARVLMISTLRKPDVSVYPDSGKVGVWPGGKKDHGLFRKRDRVGYYEGETG